MMVAGLRLENTECGQIVLHLLECSQRRLTIICGRCVESRNGRFRGCLSPAGIKQSLHSGWTYSPETARPVEPVHDRGAFESDNSGQHHGWEESPPGDPDLFVPRLHTPPALR